ncbi:MAG: hypothetical protein M1826_003342 [Phylliscum demangeonii]|nr:MAG: hypothetical protein M1826_003342 [Phylliscum demangeonii]
MEMPDKGFVAPAGASPGATAVASQTSITIRERETFDRIFREIAELGTSRKASKRAGAGAGSAAKGSSSSSSGSKAWKGPDRSIPRHMARRQKEAEFSFAPDMDEEARQRVRDERSLLRYPEPLRAAAAEAMRRAKMLAQATSTPSAVAGVAAALGVSLPSAAVAATTNALQVTELNRVVGMMRAALTDQQLWVVLEDEVFPMVATLEIEGAAAWSTAPTVPKLKSKRKRKADRKIVLGAAAAAAGAPPPRPPTDDTAAKLALIGPNYPHLLLLATRILRHELRQTSACLTLFERVKALGPISYVLGASTALYNELIGLRWRAYADPHAVDLLLADMQAGGVPFDAETRALVDGVVREAAGAAAGGHAQPLWSALWRGRTMREGVERVRAWQAGMGGGEGGVRLEEGDGDEGVIME